MKKMNENMKVTLTLKQLKKLVKESMLDMGIRAKREEEEKRRKEQDRKGFLGKVWDKTGKKAVDLLDDFAYGLGIYKEGDEEASIDEYQVTDANNPLHGKSRQSAQKFVYKVIGDHKGIFRDDNWKHVHEIFNRMRAAGLDLSYGPVNDRTHSGGYFRNEQGQVAGKEWEFTIDFINNRDRECTITGRVIASFGGTVDQAENDDIGPDRPYDIVVTLY